MNIQKVFEGWAAVVLGVVCLLPAIAFAVRNAINQFK